MGLFFFGPGGRNGAKEKVEMRDGANNEQLRERVEVGWARRYSLAHVNSYTKTGKGGKRRRVWGAQRRKKEKNTKRWELLLFVFLAFG